MPGHKFFHHSEGEEGLHVACLVQRGWMFVLHHLHVDGLTSAYETCYSRMIMHEDVCMLCCTPLASLILQPGHLGEISME